MSIKVLGISSSPRLKGNSDMYLSEAISEADSAGRTHRSTQYPQQTSTGAGGK